jgi:hypothetical protein
MVSAPMAGEEVIIEHPNREQPASRATRAVVIVLLLVSAVLVAVITVVAWDLLVGAKGVQIAFVVAYVVMAFYVARWNRGVLPVAAALAIILLIFAAVSAPAWLDRDQPGFEQPVIDAGVLGFLTFVLVPVQVLLIVAALQGFAQAWNVEVERRPERSARSLPVPS